MNFLRNAVAQAIFLLLVATSAQAYEARFGINPALKDSLPAMAKNHTTMMSSGRNGSLFHADASAVLKVDIKKIFNASLDYDNYVKFGMPHLNESRLVERASPDLLYVFSSMSFSAMSSSQYMEVRVHRSLSAKGSMGMEWEITPKRPGWKYAANPSFSRMDGSFYVEPLADGNVYVRYFLINNVDIGLAGMLSRYIQRSLRTGAADVIMALARQAPVRR